MSDRPVYWPKITAWAVTAHGTWFLSPKDSAITIDRRGDRYNPFRRHSSSQGVLKDRMDCAIKSYEKVYGCKPNMEAFE